MFVKVWLYLMLIVGILLLILHILGVIIVDNITIRLLIFITIIPIVIKRVNKKKKVKLQGIFKYI